MNRHRIRRAALLVCCVLTLGVARAETTGSLRLHFSGQMGAYPGMRAALWRVAERTEGRFLPSASFSGAGVDFERRFTARESEQAAQTLYRFAMERQVCAYAEKTADDDGWACFPQLPCGVYLAAQAGDAADGSRFAPFLISIPLLEGETALYDVEAVPKLESAAPWPTPAPGNLPQTGTADFLILPLTTAGLLLLILGVWLLARKPGRHE